MERFKEAFIKITSLFILTVIAVPIVILGVLRFAQEIGGIIFQ